jgi:prophage regulatory protein
MAGIEAERYLRVRQIIGDKRDGAIPVAHSTWWKWVAEGRAPQPIRFGPKTTVWRASDIEKMIRDGGWNGNDAA